jgi:hypothetical protein
MKLHNRLQRLSHDRRLRPANDNGANPDPEPLHLRTVADVLALLEEQVEAIRADDEASALEIARTAGYLAGIALRAIETGNLAARIEMLEMVLKQRDGDGEG